MEYITAHARARDNSEGKDLAMPSSNLDDCSNLEINGNFIDNKQRHPRKRNEMGKSKSRKV